MLVSTIDFYLVLFLFCLFVSFFFNNHVQWPWPRLGVTRSAQNKICWLHCLASFPTERSEMYGDEALLTEHLETNFVQTWYGDRYYYALHWNSCWCDLDVPNVWTYLNGIWHDVEFCWCDQSHTHFILSDQMQGGRILHMRLDQTLACNRTLKTNHFCLSNLVWW